MEKQVSYIKDARHLKSPTVIGCITRLGDITEGTSKAGEQYKSRKAQLTDNSGEIAITLWGDDCTAVALNDYIKIASGYMTNYKGESILTVGKYGTLTKVEGSDLLPELSQSDLMDSINNTSDGEIQQTFTGNGKDDDTEFAEKILEAYVKKLRELDIDNMEGCSAVWNTACMHHWRK